ADADARMGDDGTAQAANGVHTLRKPRLIEKVEKVEVQRCTTQNQNKTRPARPEE
ncbi:hypothetical protein HK101_005352, partial [Irineochytrium annulatum]